VTAHDHVVPARLQARSVGLADFDPALRQAGCLLPGNGYRSGISVDANRLSRGTDPFRQYPQHGAGAASHIGYAGAPHDAPGQPLRGFVVRGARRHHAVAHQLLLTQSQAVAGSPGVAAALHEGNVPDPIPCTHAQSTLALKTPHGHERWRATTWPQDIRRSATSRSARMQSVGRDQGARGRHCPGGPRARRRDLCPSHRLWPARPEPSQDRAAGQRLPNVGGALPPRADRVRESPVAVTELPPHVSDPCPSLAKDAITAQ
jgi:hypothetical protein